MDTPQVTPELLDAGLARLANGADAVFGAATDGGYWAIGLARPDPRVFDGVPMSEPHTGAAQRARLRALGLETHYLPLLRDVDTFEDARRGRRRRAARALRGRPARPRDVQHRRAGAQHAADEQPAGEVVRRGRPADLLELGGAAAEDEREEDEQQQPREPGRARAGS